MSAEQKQCCLNCVNGDFGVAARLLGKNTAESMGCRKREKWRCRPAHWDCDIGAFEAADKAVMVERRKYIKKHGGENGR